MIVTTVEQVLVLPSVPYGRRERLPSGPGIYFAVIDDEYVAYVGISTTSIRQRWAGHHRKHSLQELGTARIAFIESDDVPALRRIEREAIISLRPRLNVQHMPPPDPPVAAPVDTGIVGRMRRNGDVLMSVAEAAAFYEVDPATVWRYITQTEDPLPATKVGRSYTLWRSDVIDYQPKVRRRRGPKPKPPAQP